MEKLPRSLELVVQQFSNLPGIGPKSALRLALTLLKWPEPKVKALGEAIIDLKQSLHLCSFCGCLSDEDPCPLCQDPARDSGQLCVVANWDGLLAMEAMGLYKGKYYVLGALLDPLDGVTNRELDLERFKKRLSGTGIKELILALGTLRESEATESLLKDLVKEQFPGVKVTRLAQGIPVGSDLKYVDPETLKQSLYFRQDI